MRQAIHEAGGVEVFAIGDVNESGMVYDLEIHCRGNEGSTIMHSRDTIQVKSLFTIIRVVCCELLKPICISQIDMVMMALEDHCQQQCRR